jgi:hypothetical protein
MTKSRPFTLLSFPKGICFCSIRSDPSFIRVIRDDFFAPQIANRQ